MSKPTRLRITEIYASVQGESTHVGKPCVFVRLTGCNLRCTWCDSEFTFQGGEWRALDALVDEVSALGIHTVEVTGGEPLLQKNCIPLLQALVDRGHEVLLETSGSLAINDVPEGVHIIMDLKPPDSGEAHKNLWQNIEHLRDTDELKFVVASRADYEWSLNEVRTRNLLRWPVLFSTAWNLVEPKDLAAWIVADRVPVRMQLQLHKFIWPPEARGV